jgi:hypothetical protein
MKTLVEALGIDVLNWGCSIRSVVVYAIRACSGRGLSVSRSERRVLAAQLNDASEADAGLQARITIAT